MTDNPNNVPQKDAEEPTSAPTPPSNEALMQEYLAGWQRARADYENLSREVAGKVAAARDRGRQDVLTEVLDVVDAFDKAHLELQKNPDESNQWVKGIMAIEEQVRGLVEKFHLVEILGDGIFDPFLHHAVGTRNEPSVEDGVVLEVLRKGWTMGDHVIRPAYVIVNQRPSEQETNQ